MVVFRQALANDLVQASEVVYENEIRGETSPPPLPDTASNVLAHILRTGTVYVAEENSRIDGFSAAITRDNVTFLTDLFVRLDVQSQGVGQKLLDLALSSSSEIRCTMSSTDPRALALYIRSGMRPLWPNFCLRLKKSSAIKQFHSNFVAIEADVNDKALIEWDAEIGGRYRPEDHSFWVSEEQAIPLWFQKDGVTKGYGYVRPKAESLWFPEIYTIGPVGARTPTAATACVLAAVNWAYQRANVLRINLPGPHPSLLPLLEARFHITYVETFVSSSHTSIFDPQCYVTSDSSLF